MPSAYCVIYASNTSGTLVLVATKTNQVPNNPGQLVFPGGRIDVAETAKVAAAREFREETGIAIDLQHNTISATKTGVAITAWEVGDFQGYSALYIRVASLDDLNKVVADAKINIKNGTVQDRELASVEVMTRRQAHATFFSENNPQDPKKGTDWFVNISNSKILA